jgi:hypothetical protein
MDYGKLPGESQSPPGRDRTHAGRPRPDPRDTFPGRDENAPSARAADTLRQTELLDESGAPSLAPSPRVQANTADWEQRVRQRAYQRFESRNGDNGSPESDWLEAERELREEHPGPRGR